MSVKKKKAKPSTQILNLETLCSVCKKLIPISFDKVTWSGYSSECDMCGSHGDVTCAFTCDCGNSYELELNSW